MTAASTVRTSAQLEQLYDLSLEQAQRLIANEHDTLIDQADAILDEYLTDRLLVETLDVGDRVPADLLAHTTAGRNPEATINELVDLAVRLTDALNQMRAAIAEDHRLQTAHYIVEAARAEGRIP
jgi:hypothetical protein